MSVQSDQDKDRQNREIAAKGRLVSLVIVGTMLLWIAAQAIGRFVGLPGRYALLFDFAALAGLFWALVVGLQIWRARKNAGASK
jgi:hypothetical protein